MNECAPKAATLDVSLCFCRICAYVARRWRRANSTIACSLCLRNTRRLHILCLDQAPAYVGQHGRSTRRLASMSHSSPLGPEANCLALCPRRLRRMTIRAPTCRRSKNCCSNAPHLSVFRRQPASQSANAPVFDSFHVSEPLTVRQQGPGPDDSASRGSVGADCRTGRPGGIRVEDGPIAALRRGRAGQCSGWIECDEVRP
jgi:hypothetical protein